MDGQPVWLCSVSKVGGSGVIGTFDWTPEDFDLAAVVAHKVLKGVGDPGRERAFRMNITFCVHRAASAREVAKLPQQWETARGGLAGGPVEVLWSEGIEHRPAAMPCESPTRFAINPARPDLWLPVDCGKCAPCRGRSAITAAMMQ